jgi:hypothetical protein
MNRAGRKERDRLRAYVLGTLDKRALQSVEADLAASEELRTELEEIRAELGRLDALPETRPRSDLAGRTLERIYEEEEAARHSLVPVWQWAAALGAIVVIAAILLPALGRAREAALRASSQSNMKQLGIVFKMYVGENQGEFPPPAPYPGVWMFDLRALWPHYLDDPSVLVDPAHPDADALLEELTEALEKTEPDWERATRLAAQSYTYPGFVVTSEEEALALAGSQDWREQFAAGEGPRSVSAGDRELPRPREGVERFFITDINNPASGSSAQSTLPILFEAQNAGPRSVLYMDGHVATVEPGAFPATPAVEEAFPPPKAE